MNQTASARQGGTLPMAITADDCLHVAMTILSSRLSSGDLEDMRKAITLYGDLRVSDALREPRE